MLAASKIASHRCSNCDGHGVVADYGPLGMDFEGPKECKECGGSGQLKDCIHCLGTGHPKCRCGGTGKQI